MTGYSELVNRYKEFRKIARDLSSTLLEQISKEAMEECARKLGMKRDTLVFRDMDETSVLMDYCIYGYCENGSNAIYRYIAEFPPEPDSNECVVLEAMSESFYTLVRVEDVLEGVGARADDLLNNRTYLIIDTGLGATAVKGLVIATRILPFRDFTMTFGAPLPVDAETFSEILESALRELGTEDGEYMNIDAQQQPDLMAMIIRICLKSDSSLHVQYEDVGIEPVTVPLRTGPCVGRNEPCPWGSGRKYKRCCGQ